MAAGDIGFGVKGPIAHAMGNGFNQVYRYRNRLGMMPSAEFNVFHDDFVQKVTSNVPAGWEAAVIDSGATAVTDSTTSIAGGTGVIIMSDATASEGISIYMPKSIILTSGKKFFMEMRVRTNDVTDNVVQFGLSDLTATTNPEDLWTTTAANLIAFGILDGSATPKMLIDASNSGTSAQTGDSTYPMVVDTWHRLAISYDGLNVHAWIDGNKSMSWSSAASTIPTGVALSPFIGVLNGNGGGGNNNYIDYFRYSQER